MAKKFTTPKITVGDVVKLTKSIQINKKDLDFIIWLLTVVGLTIFLLIGCRGA